MSQEKEIKLYLKKDLADFIVDIEKNGYISNGNKNVITDIYLDTEDWKLYNSIAALRLRLKESDIINSLSFKKFFNLKLDNEPWYIEELEAKAPFNSDIIDEIATILMIDKQNSKGELELLTSCDSILNFFSNHGFKRQISIKKTRSVYKKGETEICIDDIENLGTLVEIESTDEEPLLVAESLLNPQEWERSIEGVSNIFMRVNYGQDKHLSYMKNFESDPAWNVWENEKEWYDKLVRNRNQN